MADNACTQDVSEYSEDQLKALLPYPEKNAHKYSRGKLALIAGSAAYPGAAVLAAEAAQRVGAGYVQAICAPQTAPIIQTSRPSVVATPWDSLNAEGDVSRASAVCLGPGFDPADSMCKAVALAVLNGWAEPTKPLVVDGGALGIVATTEGRRALRTRTAQESITVLTPHGGEAAKLAEPLGLMLPKKPEDEQGQARLARELAVYYSSTVVLKGPNTYISDGINVVRMTRGTAVLAKAGTGDILAGMIGGLLAQGLQPLDACVLGATWHAEAGNCAQEEFGIISATPEDVVKSIPAAFRKFGE